MKRFIYLLLVILIISCSKDKKDQVAPMVEKYGGLEGYIKNKFGQPIDGADVTVGSFKTISDINGKYLFDQLPINDYNVSVSKNSFLSDVKPIKIVENTTTKLDFALESGNSYLSISDSLLNFNQKSGGFYIKISSNSGWMIKSSSPSFTITNNSGNGNNEVSITYINNTKLTFTTDTIQFISGTLIKNLVVRLYPVTQLLSYEALLGNSDAGSTDSVYLHFNNSIKSITIKSNYLLCQNNISYNFLDNNRGIKFSYQCGALGGNYPFTITATDELGNFFMQDINVPFYDSKLDIAGLVTDCVLVNGEKEAIISTYLPNKLIRYSIDKDTVLQTYDLSNIISPQKLSYNPYNKKIYIMGAGINSTDRYANVNQPDIYTFDVQTGKVTKALTILPDAADAPQYPVNIPFNIGFTKTGYGMILLRSNTTSTMRWKLIDCTKDDLISSYPTPVTDADYFDNVQMNYDQTKLILTQTYTGSCNYGVFDGYTQKVSILRPSSVTRSVFITPNRKNDQVYFGQLYDQFVMDLNGHISKISYLDNRSNGTADFSYRPNEDNIIYFCDDSSFKILNYNNSSTIVTTRAVSGFRKLTSTINGKIVLAYKQNNDLSSALFKFSTENFYRNKK